MQYDKYEILQSFLMQSEKVESSITHYNLKIFSTKNFEGMKYKVQFYFMTGIFQKKISK